MPMLYATSMQIYVFKWLTALQGCGLIRPKPPICNYLRPRWRAGRFLNGKPPIYYACRDGLLVHVRSATSRMYDFHTNLPYFGHIPVRPHPARGDSVLSPSPSTLL